MAAALYLVHSGPPVFGNTPILRDEQVDASAIRRYREAHPGTTITEAVAALQR